MWWRNHRFNLCTYTYTKAASACNQILRLTNCIKMKSDKNIIFSYPNFILKLFSVYLFQLISLIRVYFANTLIITIIIINIIIIVIIFQHFIAVLKVSPYIWFPFVLNVACTSLFLYGITKQKDMPQGNDYSLLFRKRTCKISIKI
jgi:hypothetical protein